MRRSRGKHGGPAVVLPGMTQLDLHAEFQRAEFSLAMSKPAEAARILERVVAAEPSNRADVVDRQDRIRLAELPAAVDDFLR